MSFHQKASFLTLIIYLLKPRGQEERKDDLDQVGEDKRHHADHQSVREGAAHHIDEPGAAAKVDQGKGKCRREVMRPMRQFEERQDEIEKRHRRECHNEAARRGEQHREAAAKSGEDGEPDGAHHEIQPDGDRATLAAQILKGKEDAENLERERHGRGDRDEGADRIDGHRKCDIRHIASIQLFQGVFFHTRFILPFRRPPCKRFGTGKPPFLALCRPRRGDRCHPFEILFRKRELNA